ncbi:ATP-binding cassette domain-containing protein [Shewanella khirikhana]|uniref:ABC-type transporter ATP-binding protein EcsA n=1 Tax=Shewanella khirikhana TaxID=1965282 RepID=A0ABN5U4B3_9GAMM|nr:ABC transporter ATP-binding protein [Shewanella khirikhana]AZQ13167.1 ABC-type transporter ATP-binding protein EcsA [Shewanella khirikhana]
MLIDAQQLGYCRPARGQSLTARLFKARRASATSALDGVSFTLEAGELLALVGHNGAGKSTLIKLLLGLIAPTSGRLQVLGQTPRRGMAGVGYLPEHCRLYPRLCAAELLSLFARAKGASKTEVDELIDAFRLQAILHQPSMSLSKGQLQRLALALALLGKPGLLLLDEPTTGLDPGACDFMYQRLDALKRGGTGLVICSHDLALLEPRCNKALFIGAGKQQAFGCIEEFVSQSGGLRQAYSRLMAPLAMGEMG